MRSECGTPIGELVRKLCLALLVLFPFLFIAYVADGQIKSFKANATDQQKSESVIYKNFVNECDLMIAYTWESYWWRTKKHYRLLAVNKGAWYKGYFFSERLRNGKWTCPRVRFEEIDGDSAMRVVDYLNNLGFTKMSQDSLKIFSKMNTNGRIATRLIEDGVNYKFEILFKNELEIIEAYEPKEYLEFLPEIKTRNTFIKCRDWFVQKYDELEPVGEYNFDY
ncbi:MAG: hypothetical protein ACTHMI_20085 [Mucilaginibacter sp.]